VILEHSDRREALLAFA